jgi:hypothetical protein
MQIIKKRYTSNEIAVISSELENAFEEGMGFDSSSIQLSYLITKLIKMASICRNDKIKQLSCLVKEDINGGNQKNINRHKNACCGYLRCFFCLMRCWAYWLFKPFAYGCNAAILGRNQE